MTRRVHVSTFVLERAAARFGPERSAAGGADEYDFVGGPLAAAVFVFRDFDSIRWDVVPSVRSYTIVDPFFGAVIFTAVLLDDGTVEVADFDLDTEYWDTVNADPDE
jgi:hypothetical protein